MKKNKPGSTHHSITNKNEIFIPTDMSYNKNFDAEFVYFSGYDKYPLNTSISQKKDRNTILLFSSFFSKLKKILIQHLGYQTMIRKEKLHVTYTYELWHFINGKKHIIEYDPNDIF
jgi:hypothetical protein